MRTRTAAALAALLLAALTGCSSAVDSERPARSVPPTTATSSAPSATLDPSRADLEKAVRAYTAAYFKPDVTTAYGMVSTRCKEQITKPALAALLDRANQMDGDRTVKRFTIDKISGGMARVSYGVGLPRYDQHGQPWTREGGHWRYDAC
ncbi:hypothetical protein [Streptomyces gilvosporeus]|uniref:Lipoprotein n=1 Tax=Streptomyces gilvosporeus TaxID=553510 RepID=A0A1V0TJN5_9ACTN|nr:hypothetical protein [Streptomyces gilvosporeus]ARF53090.1 hypothetical protein B1H19_01845 [Streptomyces gilvosporeus]